MIVLWRSERKLTSFLKFVLSNSGRPTFVNIQFTYGPIDKQANRVYNEYRKKERGKHNEGSNF